MEGDRDARRRFIEDAGNLMDEHALPHMAGKVIGALLICVPPHMALDELAEELQASKGAISMATRLLLRIGILEKVSLPGHRRRYYRIRPNLWEELFVRSTEHFERHVRLVEEGLEIMRREPIEMRRRLVEMKAFTDFLADELPGLVERWRKRRPGLVKRSLEKLKEEDRQ